MESDESLLNEIAESHAFFHIFSITMLCMIPHLHYFCPVGVIVVGSSYPDFISCFLMFHHELL